MIQKLYFTKRNSDDLTEMLYRELVDLYKDPAAPFTSMKMGGGDVGLAKAIIAGREVVTPGDAITFRQAPTICPELYLVSI